MNVLKKTLSTAGSKMNLKKSSYGNDKTFLHGQLLIEVISAEDLPDLEGT